MSKQETQSSQVHTSASSAASQSQQNFFAFGKLTQEQLSRMGAMLEEAQKLESRMFEYGATAVDEYASLMKGTLRYAGELTNEWRRMSLESAKRAAELFTRS